MQPKPTPDLTHVLPVAFTGAPGAYSEEAARRLFGRQAPTLACEKASSAVENVVGGRAGRAVVPIENTVTGTFEGVASALVAGGTHIVGEVNLAIRHCLLAVPGAKLANLGEVISHPSALAHCSEWLSRWGVVTRTSTDTARAARDLVESGDKRSGVLGSRVLAEIYGLDILADGLSDHARNETRFWVLAAEPDLDPTAHRTAVLVGPVTLPRVLKSLRMQLEARGTVRTRAPLLRCSDGEHYVLEFDHPPGCGAAIAAEACDGVSHRLLGSWSTR